MHSTKSKGRANIPMLATNSRQSRSDNFGWNLTGGYSHANQNVNHWSEAGYPDELDFSMHWAMQARNGIAKAGIMLFPNKCWKEAPMISDGEPDKDRALTPFEQDLKVLIEKHDLFKRLKGLDWKNRVGRYAGLIPIVKDNKKADEPLEGLRGIQSILKLVPVFESQIDTTDIGIVSDLNDVDYGMPEYYNFREDVSGDRNPIGKSQQRLHRSRVYIFAEGADDGSIFGIPANEAGYNALLDMEIIAASGQMGLHRNAKQRFISSVNDNQVAAALKDKDNKEAYDTNVNAFHKGGSPNLVTYGMDIHALNSTLADPTAPFTNSMNIYAASINAPASEILGVQMNKQASEGNATALNETCQSRCENDLTPMLIGFFDYLIKAGAMRPYKELNIKWPDFSEPSKNDKLDAAKKMLEINKLGRESGIGPVFTVDESRQVAGSEVKPDGELPDFSEDNDDENNQPKPN